MKKCFGVLIGSLMLAGCTGVGKFVLPPDRYGLNESLQLSQNQQLLLNVVRLRYGEAPLFLGVGNITSSFNLSYGSSNSVDYTHQSDQDVSRSIPGVSVSVGKFLSQTWNGFVNPSSSYSQSPTIFYTPLQGEAFTTQLFTPLKLDKYYLLSTASWGLERILKVTVASIGPYENVINRFGVNSDDELEYKKFNEVVHLLNYSYRKKFITFSVGKLDQSFSWDLTINKQSLNEPAIKRLRTLLKIKDISRPVRFIHQVSVIKNPALAQQEQIYPLVTRSLIGIMHYLSTGVEVTSSDVQRGTVQPLVSHSKEILTGNDPLCGVIKIRNSSKQPKNPSIVVHYRNRYYYIADDDWNSKETMMMLYELYELLAGNVNSQQPLIAVPA